jgi:hypothetical protein
VPLSCATFNSFFGFNPQGFVVFAGCLAVEGDGAKKLKKEAGDNLVLVQMNVVSDDEIESALEYITEEIEKRGIHGKYRLTYQHQIFYHQSASLFGFISMVL